MTPPTPPTPPRNYTDEVMYLSRITMLRLRPLAAESPTIQAVIDKVHGHVLTSLSLSGAMLVGVSDDLHKQTLIQYGQYISGTGQQDLLLLSTR